MNHGQASWRCPSGRDMHYEYWEVRQGLYARIALVLHDPYVPFKKEEKFLKLLIDLRFKVYSASPLTVSRDRRQIVGLDAAASDLAAFAAHLEEIEALPIALVALSFNAVPALYSAAAHDTRYCLAVLAAPVLDWTTLEFQKGFCLDPRLSLPVDPPSLISSMEYLGQAKEELPVKLYTSKHLVKDVRTKGLITSGFASKLAPRLPLLVVSGEDDSLTGQVALSDLKKAWSESKATFKVYPRVRHLIAFEKYWNHAAKDIEEFVAAY